MASFKLFVNAPKFMGVVHRNTWTDEAYRMAAHYKYDRNILLSCATKTTIKEAIRNVATQSERYSDDAAGRWMMGNYVRATLKRFNEYLEKACDNNDMLKEVYAYQAMHNITSMEDAYIAMTQEKELAQKMRIQALIERA